MTRQMTSSTTSSIASEEARTAVILGSKRQCLHMSLLSTCIDVNLCMDVMLCMNVMNIVMFE
jgi:hypothetical protein